MFPTPSAPLHHLDSPKRIRDVPSLPGICALVSLELLTEELYYALHTGKCINLSPIARFQDDPFALQKF
jgi:hypothetical protein